MSEPTIQRTFLVGCPRSGTTLLQAMLASHPDVVSFPESNFVNVAVGDYRARVLGDSIPWYIGGLRRKARLWLGLSTANTRSSFRRVMESVGRPDLGNLGGNGRVTIHHAISAFLRNLDLFAYEAGYARWLDKSPTYYAYIDHIESVSSSCQFIHLVRRGEDVVASLVDAARKYPGSFWEKQFSDPEKCVMCWNLAVEATSRYVESENHRLVTFELLLDDPERTLTALSDWLNLHYSHSMLEAFKSTADSLRLENEPWKSGAGKELRAENKFSSLFSLEEQKRIRRALIPIPKQEI